MKRWSFFILIGMMDCRTASAQGVDLIPVRNEDGQLLSIQTLERSPAHSDSPTSATAHVLMGHLLLSRGDELGALRSLQTGWHADPSRVEILPDIVAIAAHNQRLPEAARYGLLALKTPSHTRDDCALLADKLNEAGEYVGASTAYRQLLRLESDREIRLGIQFDLARCLFLAGDFQGAAKAYSRLLQGMQTPPAAAHRQRRERLKASVNGIRWLIAETFLIAGKPSQAAPQYRAALSTPADKPRLLVAEAKVALAQGRAERAWQQWTTAVSMPVRSESIDFAIAEQILRKRAPNNWRKLLLSHLLQLREQFPRNQQLARMSASALWQAGRYEESIAAYDAWHDLAAQEESLVAAISAHLAHGGDGRLLQLLTEMAQARGSLSALDANQLSTLVSKERMRRLVRQAMSRKEVDPGEALALGLLAVRQRNLESTQRWMKQALADLKTTDRVWQAFGLEWLEVGDPRQSRLVFQRALGDDRLKRRDLIQYYLAGAALVEGRLATAIEAAQAAVKSRPQEPRFAERLGLVFVKAGRLSDAQRVFERMLVQFDAVRDEPTRRVMCDVRIALADVCLRRGSKRQAQSWLKQVLNEYPSDIRARHDLGYLWVDQGRDLARAMTMIQTAVAANPENSTYRRSLGWALYRKGEYGKAVKELERALSGAVDGVILDHLGDAYWGAGRADHARKAWSRAFEHLQDDDSKPRRQAVQKKVADLDAGRLKIRR